MDAIDNSKLSNISDLPPLKQSTLNDLPPLKSNIKKEELEHEAKK
jgi:hypothetical protein